MKKGLIFAVLGFIVLTQYVNCSSYSEGTLYAGNISTETEVISYEGIRILNGDTYMNCDEDHVQIGGNCNAADAQYNCLEARMYRDRTPVQWGTTTLTDNLGCTSSYRIECENGRFYAVIPKPNDAALTSGTSNLEYKVQFQMHTSTDGAQFNAGEKSTEFSVYIQQNGACGI